jgi:hypothetical protein
MSGRRLVCPDCGRRGIIWQGLPNGEDNYYCMYKRFDCTWFAFTDGKDAVDREQLARLEAANPSAPIWV